MVGFPTGRVSQLNRWAVSAHVTDAQNPQSKPKEEDPVPVNAPSRETPIFESKPIGPGQFGTFLAPQINNRGDIAFIGRYPTSGGTSTFGQAIFIRSADGKWRAVRDTDRVKNLDETGFAFSQFDLNEQGDVTLLAAFGRKPVLHTDTHGGTTPAPVPSTPSSMEKNAGIFSSTSQGFVNHFALGQEVPNMPSRFSSFSNPSMNSKGTMAFIAAYIDPDGRGLFISENGKLRIAARSGQRLKPNEPQVFSEHYYPSRINERGEVAFLARIGVGAGIFVLRSTGIELIAIDGAPSPVPGAKYLGFANRTPAINDKGEVAFSGFYDGPNAGRALFFKGLTGQTRMVATSTDKTAKFKFKDFASPAINNNGDIVFMGTLEGGFRQGIYLKTAKGIEPIAVAGEIPPGMKPGEEFNNFQQQPSLNDRGEVVFYAQLKNATVGVFIKDANGLRPVMLRGDKIPPTN
jgi:hypothetical protein